MRWTANHAKNANANSNKQRDVASFETNAKNDNVQTTSENTAASATFETNPERHIF
jgi:hypothetical protein